MSNIDFVVTWVDENDKKWQEKKFLYTKNIRNTNDNSAFYRDYGTLKFWFRMVEKNASWVNRIFLITDRQLPDWINIEHPKLKVVYHDEYIPKDYLPTFNSNTIELNLHRIDELSENFVLFNDDTYIINKINPDDYFKNDIPRLYAIYNVLIPNEPFIKTLYNNTAIINKYFDSKLTMRKNIFKFLNFRYGKHIFKNLFLFPFKISGYSNMHLPSPLKKSVLSKLWNIEFDKFDASSKNKVRNYQTELNHYIINYWNIETNNFLPANVSFGKNIKVNDFELINGIVCNKKNKILCINDNDHTDINNIKELTFIFERLFPEKSNFEK